MTAWILCVVSATACSARATRQPGLSAGAELPKPRYFGQETPAPTPVRFAPGIVSTDAIELNGVFAPDGNEFLFTRIVDGEFTMHHSVFGDSGWSVPRPLRLYPNEDRALAVDMALSPDGGELYFLGRHPSVHAPKAPGFDLWVRGRVDREWSTAQIVPPPVSTDATESYPSVVADGSLYFSSDRPGGLGTTDVYRAQRLADGRFDKPVNVGPPINSEFGEGDTFLAPDESYLIVASGRPGGFGQADLYVSFRRQDGSWGEATRGDVYWVDA